MNPTAPALLPGQDVATQEANGNGGPLLDPSCLPRIDDLITQDDTPVDNYYVERLQRLLTEPLYSSWDGPGEGRNFVAGANVGLFAQDKNPAFVPDFLLGIDVSLLEDVRAKESRSYFIWVMGHAPDLVLEIVSDRRGGEDSHKLRAYARMGVPFYVIYDPDDLLKCGVLRAFGIARGHYQPIDWAWIPEVRLGLRFWEGEFQGWRANWLRWCDEQGNVIRTGAERADDERRRADDERRRADDERRRADEQIKRLQAQIRALGAEPEV